MMKAYTFIKDEPFKEASERNNTADRMHKIDFIAVSAFKIKGCNSILLDSRINYLKTLSNNEIDVLYEQTVNDEY